MTYILSILSMMTKYVFTSRVTERCALTELTTMIKHSIQQRAPLKYHTASHLADTNEYVRWRVENGIVNK